MKLVLFCALGLLICYIDVVMSTASKASTAKKTPGATNLNAKKTVPTEKKTSKTAANKNTGSTTAKKSKDQANRQRRTPPTSPFDKVLEKLSKCASASPSLVQVIEDNLKELQSNATYASLFKVLPHTAAFLNKKKHDPNKFISKLRQTLNADWASPAWVSWKETEPLFQPLKQQFVYATMRFKCNDPDL